VCKVVFHSGTRLIRVALQAGFSSPQRITLSEVAEHRKKDDAWSVFNGKVYNITPYMDFHPGGASQLMKCAGKDGMSHSS
jgi:cytochrome b involved in lipid metabolism